jgi:hypothetical protein
VNKASNLVATAVPGAARRLKTLFIANDRHIILSSPQVAPLGVDAVNRHQPSRTGSPLMLRFGWIGALEAGMA